MNSIYRYFPCDGMCGRYIEVPAHIARRVMKPNGTIMLHDEVLCATCEMWIEFELELQISLADDTPS